MSVLHESTGVATGRSLLKRVSPALWSFHPLAMPASSRANYRRELLTAATYPFLLTGVETGVVTVLVRNAFDGVVGDTLLNYIVGILAASKALANVVSFLWVRLNQGRDKRAFTISMMWSILVIVVLLAFIPKTSTGLMVFTVGVLLSRAIWSGMITIRSTIWNANYPRAVRARITGKFATVQVIVVGLLGAGMGAAMDWHEDSFRWLFIAGAAVSTIGIWSWSRIRIRGHKALMRAEADDALGRRTSNNPLAMFGILVHDRAFGGYMLCMFVLGTGNLMVAPLLAIVVKERFGMGYFGGMLATSTIPMLMMPVLIPLWSRLLSHWHVVKFRTIHAWVFALANVMFLVASLLVNPTLLFLAAMVQGIAFGGGALAWTLGHLDFAPPNRASQYMGVHVTLTGVRGLFAPFIAVGLYQLLEHGTEGAGSWVFGLSAVLSGLGGIGFLILTMRMHLPEKHRDEPIEITPPSRTGN
ncbi:MAG: MFS transporter [Planctomycetes bacterium]|nr:MFS transporter [Planctomycetota bacterium]